MKKQQVLVTTFCVFLLVGFAFKPVPQQPKIIISGHTTILGGEEENLFMVGKVTDFKIRNQEEGAEVTIMFTYRQEELSTKLKPGNEIRLLADDGFIAASVAKENRKAVLRWELFDR